MEKASSWSLAEALERTDEPFWVRYQAHPAGAAGAFHVTPFHQDDRAVTSAAVLPACQLAHLGDRSFADDYGLRYAYLAGSMANGIGSVQVVEAMGRSGMLAFFGSAGLSLSAVAQAIDRLSTLGAAREACQKPGFFKKPGFFPVPYGFNLIHSPSEPVLEAEIVDLYLRRRVHLVEASAYLDLTLPVVRYRLHGIHRDETGRVITPNRIIAKVSRVEVASKFLAPPPDGLVQELVRRGDITSAEAELARRIPMAQDITAEADSAGHTDNRPALTLLPTMLALRDRLQAEYRYHDGCHGVPLRIGAAGGIATPQSAAAALAMGAAYLVTGSVNQACVESGSSDVVRALLAQAEQADVTMAPAADMFEMGVKLQVLKRGTMFPMRAAKLYEIYRTCTRLEDIPDAERAALERNLFRMPLEEVWQQTVDFFRERDPGQLERASRDPRHKMALVFRWYLGWSSRWANTGEPSRKLDYQVWCGPAMGAFNEWVRGSFLEQPHQRRVATVALNILYGAAKILRANCLRMQGIPVPPDLPRLVPWELPKLEQQLQQQNSS